MYSGGKILKEEKRDKVRCNRTAPRPLHLKKIIELFLFKRRKFRHRIGFEAKKSKKKEAFCRRRPKKTFANATASKNAFSFVSAATFMLQKSCIENLAAVFCYSNTHINTAYFEI